MPSINQIPIVGTQTDVNSIILVHCQMYATPEIVAEQIAKVPGVAECYVIRGDYVEIFCYVIGTKTEVAWTQDAIYKIVGVKFIRSLEVKQKYSKKGG